MKFVHIALAALCAVSTSAYAQAQSPAAQTPVPPTQAVPLPPAPPAGTGGEAVPATPDAPAAPASPPPLVLLLDGLGVYVETPYIGVSLLAGPLQKQGFRTRTDSHLMTKTQGLVPDVIIGHSMGGETALRYARKVAQAGRPAPLVITIDAAPAPPACAVPRCVNIAGPGFQKVRGAVNVSAWDSGARFIAHAQLPTHPTVQRLILTETAAWMTAKRNAAARVAAAKPMAGTAPSATAPRPGGSPSAAPAQPAARAPAQQMWSMPGWGLPGWPPLGAAR